MSQSLQEAYNKLRQQRNLKAEAQRKAAAKESKALNRCRFLAGQAVCSAFPSLLRPDLAEDDAELKRLEVILSYLAQHPDTAQQILEAAS